MPHAVRDVMRQVTSGQCIGAAEPISPGCLWDASGNWIGAHTHAWMDSPAASSADAASNAERDTEAAGEDARADASFVAEAKASSAIAKLMGDSESSRRSVGADADTADADAAKVGVDAAEAGADAAEADATEAGATAASEESLDDMGASDQVNTASASMLHLLTCLRHDANIPIAVLQGQQHEQRIAWAIQEDSAAAQQPEALRTLRVAQSLVARWERELLSGATALLAQDTPDRLSVPSADQTAGTPPVLPLPAERTAPHEADAQWTSVLLRVLCIDLPTSSADVCA